MNNKQLFTRLGVYIIVFVLVTISYVNFTNNQSKTLDENVRNIVDIDENVKAIEEEDEEELEEDDEKVLGEIDINEFDIVVDDN